MSANDEFRSLPPEQAKLPKEIAYRKSEENPSYIETVKTKLWRAGQEKKAKQKRNAIIKLLAGTVASVSIITGAGNAAQTEAPVEAISQYQFYTRLEAGKVAGNPDAVFLTEEGQRHVIGAIVSKEPVDLTQKLELEFDLLMTEGRNQVTFAGADGVSVAFSKYENVFLEYEGGMLGYDGEFGCEFDLCENLPEDTPGGQDYTDDHISILGDSVWKAYTTYGPMQLDDGEYHHITVTYYNYFLTVKYDRKTVAKSSVDNEYDELFLKICGSTGDGTCYQEIANVKINGEKVIIDDGYCDEKTDFEIIGEPEKFGDETVETNTDSQHDVGLMDFSEDDTNVSAEDNNDTADSDEQPDENEGGENESLETVLCAACNGTGIICPGSVAADDPEGCHGAVIVDCKACNGTGFESNGKLCNWCKGTLKHMCPSFEFHYECPTCGGSGYIEE